MVHGGIDGSGQVAKHESSSPAVSDFEAGTDALIDVSGDYTVDAAHTTIGVRARHAMITTVSGVFTRFDSDLHLDAANPQNSSARIWIDASSIDTGRADRDAHLRSEDFFDVAGHPTIDFVSTRVRQVGTDVYRVTGDLTIKDVTRSVDVDFTLTGSALDPFNNLRVGFEGGLVLRRHEWGVTWNAELPTGGFLVSDVIQIEFDVSAIRAAPPQPGELQETVRLDPVDDAAAWDGDQQGPRRRGPRWWQAFVDWLREPY